VKTIADIARFTRLPETSQIKSLVMVAGRNPVLVLLRGDHQLSEAKLSEVLQCPDEIRAATPAQIQQWFGAAAGSLGPVGVTNMRVLADHALASRRNMICGANQDGYHVRNVTPQQDFTADFCDLRQVTHGDTCRQCAAAVELRSAIEVARLSKLGAAPAEGLSLHAIDPDGKETTLFVASYSLSVERIFACIAELNHDENGMRLPAALAPFTLVVTPIAWQDPAQYEATQSIYRLCLTKGLDVLLDDRDQRPGVKFKDADLIGVPWRVVVGSKASQGLVELVDRRTGSRLDVHVDQVADRCSGPA